MAYSTAEFAEPTQEEISVVNGKIIESVSVIQLRNFFRAIVSRVVEFIVSHFQTLFGNT